MNEKIIPFTYRVSADKKRAFPLFFTIIFISCILVVASMLSPLYSGVISILAICALTASVLVYHRFIISDYYYSVQEGEEGNALFVATKKVGKRVSTLAYAELYTVRSIQKLTKEGLKARKTPKDVMKYNLNPSYSPDCVYLMEIRNANGEFEVVLECTDEVAARLLEYSLLAKEDKRLKQETEEE